MCYWTYDGKWPRELLVDVLQDRSRLAYIRYNGGVSNLLEALDADRNLFNAELAGPRRDVMNC